MKIGTVAIQVRDLDAFVAFYEGALGLTGGQSSNTAWMQIGSTRLEAVENPAAEGSEHLAITIPSNKFEAAKQWLSGRVKILGTPEADEFECSPSWNAHSVYFAGPNDSVLELIIRRDLDNSTGGPFTSRDLLNISEVGIAVQDVRGVASRLEADAGITAYGASPSASFAALGDVDGLLILVTPERPWFPTSHLKASATSTTVEARGGNPGNYPLGFHSALSLRT